MNSYTIVYAYPGDAVPAYVNGVQGTDAGDALARFIAGEVAMSGGTNLERLEGLTAATVEAWPEPSPETEVTR